MNLVIVGYGPGGVAAATAARAFDSKARIAIITEETIPSHRKPGSSLALEYPGTKDLQIIDWSFEALSKRGIEVITGSTVVSGDTTDRTLQVVDEKGNTTTRSYDNLILSTGGLPAVPDIPGTELEGVYTIQDMTDTSRIGEKLSSMKSLVIVGAGFSGLETAERLYNMKKEVHLIIRSRLMRRLLEVPMSENLLARIPKGINIHLGASPTKLTGTKTVEGLELGDKTISADSVLFMTGVKANSKLAEALGLRIGDLGGIVVNDRMETSVDSVYAVGDCVEMKDVLTGKPSFMPIGSVAARAGRQAGVAAVGGKKLYDDTNLRFQYDRIFGTDIVCVGNSSVTASSVGVETKLHFLEDPAEMMKVALVTTSDNTIIGGQVLAARMGAQVGYQLMERIETKAKLDERPLLKSRHLRIKDLMESSLGPIQ
ncbi:MAG: NAD(P)/FAD-dependent oxidoreductase [Candidatus Thorarchaeota archaeon]|jgi:NADH oxidase (H2O2-forming)